MKLSFEYGFTKVRDLRVASSKRSRTGKLTVSRMEVGGQHVEPTDRFWRSFFIRFGISDSVFRYFDPAEVFESISQQAPDDSLRYCLQHGGNAKSRLLAVSNPNRPMIRYGEVADLVSRFDGLSTSYNEGIVTSTHVPRSGDQTFKIGGDCFQHRFVMETPIDGFSHPKVFLSYLRTVCSNGMVGYGRAFRSDISLGKDIAYCISRALESFDNPEGYAALRQRFESAQNSWASVHECVGLYRCLTKMNDGTSLQAGHWSRDFHRMTGNLHSLYGLANLDTLSQKRQRVLPARCRVYDLLNFASEMATHRATPMAGRHLQAYIGSLISDEYDMEGTVQTVTDFTDFFVKDPGVNPNLN